MSSSGGLNDEPPGYVYRGFGLPSAVQIGPYSLIGIEPTSEPAGSIGEGSVIGAYCIVDWTAKIGDAVIVDHFCRIGARTRIGSGTRILYNARIFADVSIGSYCVISGDVPNRVVIGDCVTFMGEVAHSYRDPTRPWDSVEPSPVIHEQSVVGMRALLIGPISIGPRAYIAAGEVVRHDVPPDSVLYRGRLSSLDSWRGVLRVREPLAVHHT
jgi:acetyltransferase-like isoleucine patch superfamily enzyme